MQYLKELDRNNFNQLKIGEDPKIKNMCNEIEEYKCDNLRYKLEQIGSSNEYSKEEFSRGEI